LDFIFIRVLGLPVWGLAASYSFGSFIQATALFYLINKRTSNGSFFKAILPIFKSAFAALGSGFSMFFILKFFDRSVWIKKLSFISSLDIARNLNFERFVLDTRYTINLIILTALVSLVGCIVYIGLSIIMKSEQVWNFFSLVNRLIKRKIIPIPQKETEPVTPTPSDSSV
jgi:hypothetical protein